VKISVQRIVLFMLNSSALNTFFTWAAIHVIGLYTSKRFLTTLKNANAPEIRSMTRRK
jgi:hypothetical protein